MSRQLPIDKIFSVITLLVTNIQWRDYVGPIRDHCHETFRKENGVLLRELVQELIN